MQAPPPKSSWGAGQGLPGDRPNRRRGQAIGPPIGEPVEGLLRQRHSQSSDWTLKPGHSLET